MKQVELIEKLKEKPLFGIEDVVRITGKNREYSRLVLHRLEDKNLIERIEKGKYTVQNDPLVYATYLVKPSYFSLWTGLRYYKLTEQLPRNFNVMVPKRKEDIGLDSSKITFTRTKFMFGFHKEKYKGFEISIADKEKLLLDCLYTHKIDVNELRELAKKLEFDKTLKYLKRMGKHSLAKRTGFLLDNYNKKISKEDLLKIKNLIEDYNYVLLDTNLPEKGERNEEWKIIDNRVQNDR